VAYFTSVVGLALVVRIGKEDFVAYFTIVIGLALVGKDW
jgi:hypothetical protein